MPKKQIAHMNTWIPASERLPEECVEVIGYSSKWIHPDYNENGTRVCFYAHGEWSSAKWNNYQDYYETAEDDPEYWQQMPKSP